MNEEQTQALRELIHDYHLGDWIYSVRENADMSEHEGNSWDHPKVKRFGDIVQTLTAMVTP